MKNFLIPTTLKDDTISAVKSAVNQSKNTESEIILVLLYLSFEIQYPFELASSPNFSDRKGSKSHVGAYLHVLNAGFLFASMA